MGVKHLNVVAVVVAAAFCAGSVVAVAVAGPAHTAKKKAAKRGPRGPIGPAGPAGAAGPHAQTIAFAPSNCSADVATPSPGCSQTVSLPGGLSLDLVCGSALGFVYGLRATANAPGSSSTNVSYIQGDESAAPSTGSAYHGGAGGTTVPLSMFASAPPNKQADGQIVYRNGATVVTFTFAAYIDLPAFRCEFFANAVS